MNLGSRLIMNAARNASLVLLGVGAMAVAMVAALWTGADRIAVPSAAKTSFSVAYGAGKPSARPKLAVRTHEHNRARQSSEMNAGLLKKSIGDRQQSREVVAVSLVAALAGIYLATRRRRSACLQAADPAPGAARLMALAATALLSVGCLAPALTGFAMLSVDTLVVPALDPRDMVAFAGVGFGLHVLTAPPFALAVSFGLTRWVFAPRRHLENGAFAIRFLSKALLLAGALGAGGAGLTGLALLWGDGSSGPATVLIAGHLAGAALLAGCGAVWMLLRVARAAAWSSAISSDASGGHAIAVPASKRGRLVQVHRLASH